MRLISRSSHRVYPLAVLLAALPVVAQQVPPAQPAEPTTQPATQPAMVTTTSPLTAEPTTRPTIIVPSAQATRPYDPNARVAFNFKDASVDSVLDYLSESLGFIIIKDGRIEGRVTVASRQPVSADEAVDLLNSVLKPVNYTAIRSGRSLRIVSRDKAKKANIPVRFGADPAQIKDTDELITQVIPLGQVDAVKLRTDLQPLFSPDADITANASSNTIVITDSSSAIRRIAQIIYAMDTHMAATSDIKVFQLEYASAASAAKLINDVFKQDTPNQQQGGGQGGNRGGFPGFPGFGGGAGGFRGMFGGGGAPGGGGAAAAGGDSGARGGKVLASADDRTNTLVVTGPTEVLKVIAGVVKELDGNPSQASTVFVYRLRNGQASRLQGVLNSLFGGSGSGGSSSGTSSLQRTPFGATSSSGGSRSGGGLGSIGSSANTGNRGTGGFGGGGFGGGGFGGGFGGGNSSNLSPSARAMASELMGQVFVVADSDTNSLIITTSPKFKEKVESILTELDRSVPQVLIKVLLAEVTHSETSDIGFDMTYKSLSTGTGNTTSVGTDFGVAKAGNGLNVGYVEGDFTAALHALAVDGKVDVLSRPSILASDNQLASILVGQNVPFVTNSQTTTDGRILNTIQYQDIGIILNVTPHINPDGKVIMDVAPEISALLKDQSVNIGNGVSASVFSKRAAQSRVAIDNGRTIVIGGLMEDKKNMLVQKVPLLGDIPVVGNLFKRTTEDKSKTELLIFLTPHVVADSSVLTAQSKDEMRGVKIVPDAVAPGTFQDHMVGMQRGATTAPAEPIYVPPAPPAPKGK